MLAPCRLTTRGDTTELFPQIISYHDLTIDIDCSIPNGISHVSITDPKGEVIRHGKLGLSNGHASFKFSARPGELELWYPVGYGEQNLYTITATIYGEVSIRLLSETTRQR